nr:hypothetical protein [Carnobacterium maltaromaticum]
MNHCVNQMGNSNVGEVEGFTERLGHSFAMGIFSSSIIDFLLLILLIFVVVKVVQGIRSKD